MAEIKKSKATAIASLVFGLFFWIPLINLICSLPAIYFGLKSLSNIKKEPLKYSGKAFAVIGISLGCLVYFLYITGIGMCLAGNESTCISLGLSFLS